MNRGSWLAGLVLLPLLAVGCAERSAIEGGTDEVSATSSDAAVQYLAAREGTCAIVSGFGGQWTPSPVFDNAPEEIGLCRYSWMGERLAEPDRGALREYIGVNGALTLSTGDEPVFDAHFVEIESLSLGAQVGAIGCDVCGIIKRDDVWVILPPEKVRNREIAIPLTDGTRVSFKLESTPGARVVSATLPPAPEGKAYADGPFYVQ